MRRCDCVRSIKGSTKCQYCQEHDFDLDLLHARISEAKKHCWEYQYHIMRMSPTNLKNAGMSSIQHGLELAMRSAMKDIDKLQKEYLKKYPD